MAKSFSSTFQASNTIEVCYDKRRIAIARELLRSGDITISVSANVCKERFPERLRAFKKYTKAISVARKLFFAKERDKAIYMSFVKHIMGVKYT